LDDSGIKLEKENTKLNSVSPCVQNALNIAQKRLAAGLFPDPLGTLQRSLTYNWINGNEEEMH